MEGNLCGFPLLSSYPCLSQYASQKIDTYVTLVGIGYADANFISHHELIGALQSRNLSTLGSAPGDSWRDSAARASSFHVDIDSRNDRNMRISGKPERDPVFDDILKLDPTLFDGTCSSPDSGKLGKLTAVDLLLIEPLKSRTFDSCVDELSQHG